jgi:NAD-dependent SIR2 family protein deacetylase
MQDTSNIVILTGAGISAESGLRTFRGSDGLWKGIESRRTDFPKLAQALETVGPPCSFATISMSVSDGGLRRSTQHFTIGW